MTYSKPEVLLCAEAAAVVLDQCKNSPTLESAPCSDQFTNAAYNVDE